MAAHALLAPSSAYRWLDCPGSLYKAPKKGGNAFADEGTFAHALSADALERDLMVADKIGDPFMFQCDGQDKIETVTDEMARYCDEGYVSHVRQRATGKVLYVERRLSIAHITGEKGAEGTCDNVILDGSTIEIGDLKYGKGVEVDPVENEQLMLYALAAIDEFSWFASFDTVRLVIYQPRTGSGQPKVWETTRDVLEQYRTRVQKVAPTALALAKGKLKPKAEHFCPSSHSCRFCAKAGMCQAQENKVRDSIADDFDCLDDAPNVVTRETDGVEDYSVERLSRAASAIGFIKDYIKAVDKSLNALLMSGTAVPGWKLVEGRRGNSKWHNEAIVEERLKALELDEDVIYEKSLLSPTTAKKLWEKRNAGIWEEVKLMIVRPAGKPNVAPESDPRPAITPNDCSSDFDTVVEGDE